MFTTYHQLHEKTNWSMKLWINKHNMDGMFYHIFQSQCVSLKFSSYNYNGNITLRIDGNWAIISVIVYLPGIAI